MEIVSKKEKIIFTEEEAKAMVLAYNIMRNIEDDAEDDEVCNAAVYVADFLLEFIEDNFENADCVVHRLSQIQIQQKKLPFQLL